MADRCDVGGIADLGRNLRRERMPLREGGDRLGGAGARRRLSALAPAVTGLGVVVLPLARPVVPRPLRRRLGFRRAAAACPLVGVVPGALLIAPDVDLVCAPAGDVAPAGGLARERRALLAGCFPCVTRGACGAVRPGIGSSAGAWPSRGASACAGSSARGGPTRAGALTRRRRAAGRPRPAVPAGALVRRTPTRGAGSRGTRTSCARSGGAGPRCTGPRCAGPRRT
jgi:hypothetical protein